jgi:hypothetical protein
MENKDSLEKRQYEYEVNESFFKHITKLFTVLGEDVNALDHLEPYADRKEQVEGVRLVA